MSSGVEKYLKSAHFTYRTLTHMTDLMTYPYTTSHVSLKSQAALVLEATTKRQAAFSEQ